MFLLCSPLYYLAMCTTHIICFSQVQKLQSNKQLTTNLLNAAQNVLITRNNMKQLLKKCTSLSEQLSHAVKNDTRVKEQPKILSPG